MHCRCRAVVLTFVCSLVACAASAQTLSPAVPHLISFSGIAPEASPGTAGVLFSIYSEQTGGAPLWQEVQNVTVSSDGHYSVVLGVNHNTGVAPELFAAGEARWLSVQFIGLAEQPRIMLVSVPYALKAADADSLGGLPASAFLRADSAAAQQTSYLNTSVVNNAAAQLSTANIITGAIGNYLPVFTNTTGDMTNSIVYQSNSRLGVNITAPSAALHVVSYVPGGATFARQGGANFNIQNYLDSDPSGNTGSITYVMNSTGTQYKPLKFDAQTFQLRPGGSSINSLYLGSNGYLGLGSTSPTDRLTVNGNIQLSGTGSAIKFADGTQMSSASGLNTNYIDLTSSQTISGSKTFSSPIIANITGNANSVTNGVYTSASYTDPAWLTALSASKISGTLNKTQLPTTAAFTDQGNTFTSGTQDFSSADATLPVKAVLAADTPATCVANKELLLKTDAPSGQQLFICNTTSDGWVAMGGVATAAAGVSSFNGRSGTVLPQAGDYAFNQIGGTVTDSQIATLSASKLSGAIPVTSGGTGLTSPPSIAGMYMRSPAPGTWGIGTIQPGDLPPITVAQIAGAATTGANTFTGNQSVTGDISATGTITAENISTTGSVALANGLQAEGGEEALRMLRTRCSNTSGATVVCSGTSFGVARNGAGIYQLTFTHPFAAGDIPSINVTPSTIGSIDAHWCTVSNPGNAQFTVACSTITGLSDVDFSVVVLGSR